MISDALLFHLLLSCSYLSCCSDLVGYQEIQQLFPVDQGQRSQTRALRFAAGDAREGGGCDQKSLLCSRPQHSTAQFIEHAAMHRRGVLFDLDDERSVRQPRLPGGLDIATAAPLVPQEAHLRVALGDEEMGDQAPESRAAQASNLPV